MASLPRQDQRLIAALGYVFTPVVPAVIVFGDFKQDPELRVHGWQALLWGVVFAVLLLAAVIAAVATIRVDLLFVFLLPFLLALPFVPGALWARRVYLGGAVNVPGLTGLARRLAAGD